MLYNLLYPLSEYFIVFNVFKYITFRTIYATVTALIITLAFGPVFISKIKQMHFRQYVRDDGPETHLKKGGTPTGGGILILLSIVVSTLLWADIHNTYILALLFTATGMGLIGFIDDRKKIQKKNSHGLRMWEKLALQTIVAVSVSTFLYLQPEFQTHLSVPFFKRVVPDLGPFYILFATFVIVGASNAVNLTDGLDGLAMGLVLIVASTYLMFAYITGHTGLSEYLMISHISGAGELAVFCGAMIGAGMGFLWFNSHPAQIFMGDVGSLSLGGSLGAVAVITKHEILLAIVGGVFVMEALSVVLQVGSFKLRKKRIFKMAPIHHHFELKGWPEPKIIVRFWIIGIVLALLAVSTLKLR